VLGRMKDFLERHIFDADGTEGEYVGDHFLQEAVDMLDRVTAMQAVVKL
jgi:hypothetical protein